MARLLRSALLTAVSGVLVAGCGGGGSSNAGDQEPPSFALEGAIAIEANTRVDADTADLLAFGGSVLTEPQFLPSTFILAGYLSAISGPRDPDDPFDDFDVDEIDRFQVPFAVGESLTVATFTDGGALPEIELRLLDLAENGIASVSIPAGSARALSLPEGSPAGDYLVELVAGASDPAPLRYVAAKFSASGTVSQSWDWPRHRYLPGRAMVSFAGAESETLDEPAMAGVQSLAAPGHQIAPDLWVMRMPDVRMARAHNKGRETLDWIEELRRQPGVASAMPDYIMSAQNTAPLEEPLFQFQWHYDLIDAPTAWQLAPEGGRGTVVAVLDTGVFFDRVSDEWHPDLAGNILDPLPAGSDFIDNDNLPEDEGNSSGGSVFHGTHVAGTIAASASNGEGGTGVAFNAGLLPVRVLGEGGTGSASGLIDALNWIGETDPPRASVVNLSLGGLPEIPALQAAVDALDEKNVVLVAAAGNESTSTPTFPAAAERVFSVSAVDGAGNIAPYSNLGPWVDLAAPGGYGRRDANLDGRPDLVISASASLVDGRLRPVYTGLQGTSMAAPHVAGVFALMKTINPDLDFGSLQGFLINGDLTSDEGRGRSDALGYGLIDASKAVSVALSSPSITVLSAEPSLVNLSTESNPIQRVLLEKSGSGSTQVVPDFDTIVSPDWLRVVPSADPLALTITLLEDKLEPGAAARATLRLDYTSDSARTLEIPVVAEVVTDELSRDAGQHFVLLVETEPNGDVFETEAQVQASVNPATGQYEFSFKFDDGEAPRRDDEVRPGSYFLVAGTDLDNDGFICQAGEACAEFPVSGLREVIEVDENTNMGNIRMTTGYSRPGISSATPEMLPRPDFKGYRLLSQPAVSASGTKTLGAEK